MIKGILIFVVLTAAIAFCIVTFRKFNYLEQWQVAKTVYYGAVCAAIAFIILATVVILF
jgi:hypothetical protein|tara:strand:- start:1198 stop:1374 length:177 start_codon:yes stop_codon:yes gene_type:complete